MIFSQFNQFTGSLKRTEHLFPLYPITSTHLQSSGSSEIMFDSLKTKPVKSAAPFTTKSTGANRFDPKTLEFMKKLQSDLEAPVFLAKGTPDKILFGITLVGIAYGLFESFRFIYLRANKKI